MGDANRYCPARVRLKTHAATVEKEHGLPLQHVEAGLEGVHVRVDVPLLERDQCQAHVRRASLATDQNGAGQAAAVLRQRRFELNVLSTDQAMAHTGSDDGDSSTRSAPRT